MAEFPLIRHVLKHGASVFEYAAAVWGCDFSASGSGIIGAGVAIFIRALNSIDCPLTPIVMAQFLAEELGEDKTDIVTEINKVIDAFRSSVRYDCEGNVVSMNGDILQDQPSFNSTMHMQGQLDPKTGNEFSDADAKVIADFDPAHLIHCARLKLEDVVGAILSRPNPSDCNVADLRSFLSAMVQRRPKIN